MAGTEKVIAVCVSHSITISLFSNHVITLIVSSLFLIPWIFQKPIDKCFGPFTENTKETSDRLPLHP